MFLLPELKSLVFDDCRKEEEWKVQFWIFFVAMLESFVQVICITEDTTNKYHLVASTLT